MLNHNNSHLNEFHTSAEWQELFPHPKVISFEAWGDVEEFEFNWGEDILSYDEYMDKVMESEFE